MNPLPIRIAALLAVLAVIVAVVARRRFQPWSFLPYLLTVFVCDALMSLWPQVFFTRTFWIVAQTLYGVLRFAVVFELGTIAFRGFQGAAQRWASLVAVSLLLSGIAAALWTPVPAVLCPVHDNFQCALYETFYFSTVPRLVNAILWMLVWTTILVRGLGLPMTRWERTVTMGLTFYMVVFATAIGAIAHIGVATQPTVTAARSMAWIALCVGWTVVASRQDATSDERVTALRMRVMETA